VSDANDWNQTVIDEFRANKGNVGGMFEGMPLTLLTTTGARSGAKRINPLVYLDDGDRLIVFASKGGAPTNPDWYHNLVANPTVNVEVGEDAFQARAVVMTGEERDSLYARQAKEQPQFAEYAEKTTRTIPVIALERI
jgi:deazaflavin-dependent oxidoreductase (nitroreductase family)